MTEAHEIEALGQKLIVYDWKDSQTIPFVLAEMKRALPQPHLGSPRLIVDIGANIGIWAFAMAKLYPEARIICYEPFALNVMHLSMGIVANGLENVTVVGCGVDDVAHEEEMACDITNSGSASVFHVDHNRPCLPAFFQTLTNALDLGQPIDLLKIDIEGGEYSLFNGFYDWERIGAISLEVHPWYLWGDKETQTRETKKLVATIRLAMGQKPVIIESSNEEIQRLVGEM